MSKLTADWLNTTASRRVTKAFQDAGYQIYFVGGCVRNTLMGRDISDIDLATDAHPEETLKLARAAGFKTIPTGLDHGTVTVISDAIPYEITTFRHDTLTDGRHAQVTFSNSLAKDAIRRDFTMNALYAAPDGTVFDPVEGLPDLQNRRVRFVGDASARIREDYLRILRFFRFHAWYGAPDQGLDAYGLAACAEGIEGLGNLSGERIGTEMIKLLSAPDPTPAIAAMAHVGVLGQVLPGADPKALGPLVHFEAGIAPDWRRRACVLGGSDIQNLWRLSNKDARHLETVRNRVGDMASLSEIAYHHGAHLAHNANLCRAAIFEIPPAADSDDQIAKGEAATFPIRASDLQGLEGPALGEKLRHLQDLWISSDFTLTKAELLSL